MTASQCRIPAIYNACPSIGDVFILGAVNVSVNSSRDFENLLADHPDAFKVSAVKCNIGPGIPLPHILVRSEG